MKDISKTMAAAAFALGIGASQGALAGDQDRQNTRQIIQNPATKTYTAPVVTGAHPMPPGDVRVQIVPNVPPPPSMDLRVKHVVPSAKPASDTVRVVSFGSVMHGWRTACVNQNENVVPCPERTIPFLWDEKTRGMDNAALTSFGFKKIDEALGQKDASPEKAQENATGILKDLHRVLKDRGVEEAKLPQHEGVKKQPDTSSVNIYQPQIAQLTL